MKHLKFMTGESALDVISEEEIEHTERIVPMIRAIKTLRSVTTFDPTHPEDYERQRKSQAMLGRMAFMVGLKWRPFSIGGMDAAWIHPKQPHPNQAILYCHGGGFTSGNLSYCRILASRLAHATGCSVLSFAYHLAPEHTFPAAVHDTLAAWDYLTYHGYDPSHITVVGDSAGGNLSLSLVRELKARGRKCPGALVLFSPWTDMTMSGRTYQERVQLDPILSIEYIEQVRKAYAGERDYADSQLSPLFGDFSGYPPTLIQVGTHEILLSDSIRLSQRMKEAGVSCKLEVWQNMFHVFQLVPLKQAHHAMEQVAAFLEIQLPSLL